MAPCSSGHHATVPKKNTNRLRKPAVEKRRRDRINSCIEQLRVILEKDLQRQSLNSKLEKADILEMTVSLLRRWLQDNVRSRRESALFLSAPSGSEPSATAPHSLQHQDQKLQHQDQKLQHQDQKLQHQDQKLQQAQGGSSSTLRPKTLQESSRVWRPWADTDTLMVTSC